MEAYLLESDKKIKRKIFAKHISRWRKTNNFDHLYPWRNSKDSYKILVSEILLKKTTRKQGKRPRFGIKENIIEKHNISPVRTCSI